MTELSPKVKACMENEEKNPFFLLLAVTLNGEMVNFLFICQQRVVAKFGLWWSGRPTQRQIHIPSIISLCCCFAYQNMFPMAC